MIWKPHVTVAAVLEKDGRFLLVQERVSGRSVYNQPAGHLEDNESLIEAVVRETREARKLVNRGIYHHLHQSRYRPKLADALLSRIPDDLESRTTDVVLEACHQFGFEAMEKRGVDTWYIEFGNQAVIDHLPGVHGETRWLGTFDRTEAVTRETPSRASAMAAPVTSTMASTAPTSWKCTFASAMPCTRASACPRFSKISRARARTAASSFARPSSFTISA